ncbi:hypothetical protein IGX29_07170 [Streptomyces sp. H28]|uniref:hypothetical protein n=1 Tax=Streptomyces sp. H28 TaxID=2775865 RepID=UPI00177C008B|nr:hypothetical protein [Streptomyces sp. H28]MBD9731607.1 hypothetical protein [Streptomyces sp. H28]
MTNRRGVVAKRAEDLLPGVPYVRGWNRAQRSAGTLADQLVMLGLDRPGPAPQRRSPDEWQADQRSGLLTRRLRRHGGDVSRFEPQGGSHAFSSVEFVRQFEHRAEVPSPDP